MTSIDAHQHFWKYNPESHAWITDDMNSIRRDFQPEDLKPVLERNGLEASVVVQVDQTEDETMQLLAYADQHDFIAGVVGWVDLRDGNLESRLEHFSTFQKIRGFRHIVQGEKFGFLAQQSFVRGVRKLADFDYAYDLLLYHHQLPEAVVFAKQIPDTRIVIDHIAKPSIRTGDIAEWKKDITEIARHENICCKVSGMVTEARWPGWKYQDFVPYLDVVVEAFGTQRLIYGSDWPVCLVSASYDEQLSITRDYFQAFSPVEKSSIMGGNAKRFYKL